ncbi:MAG: deoxyribose-phosphate aldolase [Elusimicrobia bacterium]|jgi:deoxyribose-phosphate aldolase|nr:deoxyribose-phosphate aldolase [Elusimicrobiota bacterium]MBR4632286.1 deoxyribose-phosphate aldolase [Elusimicrobiota bacterium]
MVNIAAIIDHTLLKPNATYRDFKLLCEQAVENRFWSVCVPPFMVETCKKALINTDVKVCTVIGFPLGYNNYVSKLMEAKYSIKKGADEIDAVINISALKSKDFNYVEKEIALLRKKVSNKILKVIVETAYLNEEEKEKIAKIILNNGVDFLKTSTGFAPGGATVEDIKFFKKILKNNVKIKASGGISTYKQAEELIRAGASRIGTSKSLQLMTDYEDDE